MKQVEAGKVEAKCDFHLTDDYAFDNATGFGKTEWMKARISHPTWRTVTYQNGNTNDVVDNHDFIEGQMNFHTFDFGTTTGRAYKQDDGTIMLYVHSNACYTLRIVPQAEAKESKESEDFYLQLQYAVF